LTLALPKQLEYPCIKSTKKEKFLHDLLVKHLKTLAKNALKTVCSQLDKLMRNDGKEEEVIEKEVSEGEQYAKLTYAARQCTLDIARVLEPQCGVALEGGLK